MIVTSSTQIIPKLLTLYVIVYRMWGDEVEVIRILHQRMSIPRHL